MAFFLFFLSFFTDRFLGLWSCSNMTAFSILSASVGKTREERRKTDYWWNSPTAKCDRTDLRLWHMSRFGGKRRSGLCLSITTQRQDRRVSPDVYMRIISNNNGIKQTQSFKSGADVQKKKKNICTFILSVSGFVRWWCGVEIFSKALGGEEKVLNFSTLFAYERDINWRERQRARHKKNMQRVKKKCHAVRSRRVWSELPKHNV